MVAKCRYPVAGLVGDYGRGLAGLLLTGTPLVLLSVTVWVAVPLGLAGTLFSAFLLRTAVRQRTVLHHDEAGLTAIGPLGRIGLVEPFSGLGTRRVVWRDLHGLRLHYYTTRRDGTDGWMVLILKAPGTAIRIDSGLPAFDDILQQAVAAAQARELRLGVATEQNLQALGFVYDDASGQMEVGKPDHRSERTGS